MIKSKLYKVENPAVEDGIEVWLVVAKTSVEAMQMVRNTLNEKALKYIDEAGGFDVKIIEPKYGITDYISWFIPAGGPGV